MKPQNLHFVHNSDDDNAIPNLPEEVLFSSESESEEEDRAKVPKCRRGSSSRPTVGDLGKDYGLRRRNLTSYKDSSAEEDEQSEEEEDNVEHADFKEELEHSKVVVGPLPPPKGKGRSTPDFIYCGECCRVMSINGALEDEGYIDHLSEEHKCDLDDKEKFPGNTIKLSSQLERTPQVLLQDLVQNLVRSQQKQRMKATGRRSRWMWLLMVFGLSLVVAMLILSFLGAEATDM